MARVAISVAVFLFLFTLSRARDLQNPFSESESESKPKPASETTTRSHSSKPQPQQQHDTVSFTLDSVDPVPLTLLNFRPINRHGHPRRNSLPLQLSLRRCRHGHRREIPYGNDMIVAGGDRRIPARWARFGVAEPSFPEMMTAQRDVHHHHHHHIHSQHHHHEKGWFAKKIREFLNLF